MPADTLKLPLTPEIPDEIREAASLGKLVIFVGAGVSRLLGGPSWETFASEALKQLAEQGHIDFAEREQMEALNPKIKLSIVIDICEATQIKLDFRRILQPELRSPDLLRIYQDLYSIGSVFVTTNYDEWLDLLAERHLPVSDVVGIAQTGEAQTVGTQSRAPREVFWRRDDLTGEKLDKPGTVIHLHGSVKEPETMVITTKQYLEHYLTERVDAFLRELFARYTVLFVGYGLAEQEILEHVFRKIDAQHYWLFPIFSYQEKLLRHLTEYYQNHCNVKLVSFSRDERDHNQLTEVVAEWATQLIVREPDYLQKIKRIDEVPDE